jgi:uncharacterized protein YodC (DUF2158 family)
VTVEGIEVGDVVALHSGGPVMTVFRIGENEEVDCNWFNDSELRYGQFKKKQLRVRTRYVSA